MLKTSWTKWPCAVTRVGSYDEDEVRVLVEEYEKLMGGRSRSFIHVRLMDLDKALPKLLPKERQAIYLHGQMGMSVRSAGQVVGMAPTSLFRRYNEGIAHLVKIMNGGR
jgi:DNA-directed RNA polymerase specialized sigma24 family protein